MAPGHTSAGGPEVGLECRQATAANRGATGLGTLLQDQPQLRATGAEWCRGAKLSEGGEALQATLTEVSGFVTGQEVPQQDSSSHRAVEVCVGSQILM